MKIQVMNGWREAPHCWPHFWKFSYTKTPAWISIGAFGFAVFVWKR